MGLEEVRKIFNQDKNHIIREYRGTGAGISKLGNEYVIVVYKDVRVNEKERKLWKGIPVYLKYVGNIRLQKTL